MAKMEKSVLAEENFSEFEEENAVRGGENSRQFDEETTFSVQKRVHQCQYENVDNKQKCNIKNLQVIGVDILSMIQNLEIGFASAFARSGISDAPVGNTDMSELVSELYEQIQLCLSELKQLCSYYSFADPEGTCYNDVGVLESLDLIRQNQQSSSPYQEDSDLGKELSAKIFEIVKLKSDNLLKEIELEALRHRQKELETQVSSVEKEKSQLEENMEIMRREVAVTAKFLDDLRSEMMDLDGNMDSQISANRILVKKSSELGNGKQEAQVHVSELEEENLLLSDRLSQLEEQLRYLTDERESLYMEVQTPESEAMKFKDEKIRSEDEMEAHKVDRKQKIEEMQKQWSEVQEECEYLKTENRKLIEECGVLQKANGELRKENMELHERCLAWETESKESEKVFSNILNKVVNLQRENQLLEEEILAQLQKKILLQDEILALKETISDTKFENEMLEASFVMLSRDYEELEAETTFFVQKIVNTCKCSKVTLEEALGIRETWLKNKLADSMRENHIQVDDNQNCNNESATFMGIELAEALEADDMCNAQLNSLLSKELSIHLDVPEKSTGEGAAAAKERCLLLTVEQDSEHISSVKHKLGTFLGSSKG
ncbi:hypothetical protein CCACVL1_09164 [Corchorus capsularis]|uniref:Uncharacterized protein n=1 Tax=Corchorus capsularis TaxID=210143 RepID=A0A1R3IXD3_COCAP|nr:hypothetical protein CCACVL1_09164 [Corchorus capsularis]